MNPLIKILIMTLCINIVAFICMNDVIWEETFVGDSDYSLFDTAKVDLGDAGSVTQGSNVDDIVGIGMGSGDTGTVEIGTGVSYVDSLSIAWSAVKLFFTFFFALPMLLIQMQLPTYIVIMFGVPMAFIYLFALVFLVRGVNP